MRPTRQPYDGSVIFLCVFRALNRRSDDLAGYLFVGSHVQCVRGDLHYAGGYLMQVIAVFIVFSAVLDAIAVGICSFLERISENVSLIAFLGFFVVNFIIAWHLAVYVVERFLVSDAQKRHHTDHMQWVNSLFVPARR